MDDDAKVRFEELEKRIASDEKRFGDIKWYFGGLASFCIMVFSVLFIVVSWNFNYEKNSLSDFKKEIRTDIGKADLPPNLVLLGENGNPLEKQDIKAKIIKEDDGTVKFTYNYAFKNEGMSSSGPINEKIYISDPIKLNHRSSDEPKYKYETYTHHKSMDPDEIPGGNYVIQYTQTIGTENKEIPPSGKYPVLLKVYYGKGKLVCANFNLVLAK